MAQRDALTMSDPPPPPLARLAPETPPPSQPVPQPVPGAGEMPAGSLPYSLPSTAFVRQRPGVLTALGVVSILGALVSLVAGLAALVFAVT